MIGVGIRVPPPAQATDSRRVMEKRSAERIPDQMQRLICGNFCPDAVVARVLAQLYQEREGYDWSAMDIGVLRIDLRAQRMRRQ